MCTILVKCKWPLGARYYCSIRVLFDESLGIQPNRICDVKDGFHNRYLHRDYDFSLDRYRYYAGFRRTKWEKYGFIIDTRTHTYTHTHTCVFFLILHFVTFHFVTLRYLPLSFHYPDSWNISFLNTLLSSLLVEWLHTSVYAALIYLAGRLNMKCATRSRDIWEVRRVIIYCAVILCGWGIFSKSLYATILSIESVNTSTAIPFSFDRMPSITHEGIRVASDVPTTFIENFTKIHLLR